MIYFIGVGPGPADLITVKGKELIEKADVIIYNEEKINGELLSLAKEGSAFVNVVAMNLEQIVVEMVARAQKGMLVVQLVHGDASEYTSKNEQLALLRCYDLEYEVVPGVKQMTCCTLFFVKNFTLIY